MKLLLYIECLLLLCPLAWFVPRNSLIGCLFYMWCAVNWQSQLESEEWYWQCPCGIYLTMARLMSSTWDLTSCYLLSCVANEIQKRYSST
jgi:hypothetical protein